MFNQLLTPVAGNLFLSFLVAALPIAVVLVMLGVLRRPAWQAWLGGLVIAFVIAILVWHFPSGLALDSVVAGISQSVSTISLCFCGSTRQCPLSAVVAVGLLRH
jgi:L-lactate permease